MLSITAFATIIGGLLVTAQANDTNLTTSNTSTANTSDLNTNTICPQLWGMNDMMAGDQGFSKGPRGHGHGYMENIDVSSEYTQKVNNILNKDTDVKNLITQGYNVTSIRPIIKSTIDANGTLTSKATTAIVTLENGTSGYASINVDIEQAKVTKIVILTRTVIDKTTS